MIAQEVHEERQARAEHDDIGGREREDEPLARPWRIQRQLGIGFQRVVEQLRDGESLPRARVGPELDEGGVAALLVAAITAPPGFHLFA